MEKLVITQQTDTRGLLAALAAVCAILVRRACSSVRAAVGTSRTWLAENHEFYAMDGDPIVCTGWKFVAYNLVAAAVCLLLCVKI